MTKNRLLLLGTFICFQASAQLYIPGATVNSNSPATYLEFNASTLWNGTIRANGSNYTSFALYQDNALRWAMYNHPGNSNALIFANSSGQDKISFTQSGFIGIGTIVPQKNLHISGTGDVEQWIEATDDGYASLTLKGNNKQWHWSKRPSTSGDALQLYYHDGTAWSAAYMAFSTDGRVGIGTAAPQWQLDVNGYIATKGQAVLDAGSNEINIGDLAGGDGYRDILHFWTHDSQRMTLDENGYLGVGTATPLDKVEIANGGIRLQRIASPLTGGATFGQIYELQNLVGNSDGIVLQANLHQFRNYNGTPEVTINNGQVGIGTTTPDARLTVKGTIHAEEVKVDLNVPAPDYVFEKGYALPSLAEVEAYITTNKHLPEIPSASEMEENGMNLKEMN